jgi:hypothetical protein
MYYLRKKRGYSIKNIETIPVDYDLRDDWPKLQLKQPAAVLDFLYHKDAIIWFDHHKDPFVNARLLDHYSSRSDTAYCRWDMTYESVTSMLFDNWKVFFKKEYFEIYPRIEEMVQQVNKVDSGKYDSVDEWYDCSFEAAKINLVLTEKRIANYSFCNELVSKIFRYGCAATVESRSFQKLYARAKTEIEDAYRDASAILVARNKTVFYDVTKTKTGVFYRFLPYLYYPKALFTVAIYLKRKKYEVSVGKNPWATRKHIGHIGALCGFFGGGGHANVGGIPKGTYEEALQVAASIVALFGWKGKQSGDNTLN